MFKNLRRAQGTIEFLVIFIAIFFFFLFFLIAVKISTNDRVFENKVDVARDLALMVRDEISLAHESSEGYSREFYVPPNIVGADYEISINESWVYVSSSRIGISYSVLNVTGNVQKGTNFIRKQGGEVLLNQES
ncbi:MAG: hypothetical protein ABIF88_00180 [archaeon]